MKTLFDEFWEDCIEEQKSILVQLVKGLRVGNSDDLMDLEESGYVMKVGGKTTISSAFADFIRCKKILKDNPTANCLFVKPCHKTA